MYTKLIAYSYIPAAWNFKCVYVLKCVLPAPYSISPENSCSWRTAGYSRVIEQDETELKHQRHPKINCISWAALQQLSTRFFTANCTITVRDITKMSSNILVTVHTSCHPTLQHHNNYNKTENHRQWNAARPPDDGRKDARNMLWNNWLLINHYFVHLVGLTFIYWQ
jgi:hypothetical protein